MSVDDPITRLLTLLNVSATKAGKRKHADEFVPSEKLNRKRKSITFATELESIVPKEKYVQPIAVEVLEEKEIDVIDSVDDIENEGVTLNCSKFVHATSASADVVDTYEQHFGVQPSALSESSRAAVDRRSWKLLKSQSCQLGMTVVSMPDDGSDAPTNSTPQIDVIFKRSLFLSIDYLLLDS